MKQGGWGDSQLKHPVGSWAPCAGCRVRFSPSTAPRWTHLSTLRNEVRTDNPEAHVFALEHATKIDPTRLIH
ncbi:hypothetical protein BJD09_23200 [Xanthomonas citri pv. citri]|nr:hypothetical protein BI314_08210 [Xanthomonas citri pv. citri]QYF46034.1 hypothetical protein HZS93_03369 [Xanthomonas citri]APR26627.1 hypothetical protein BJD09_23200 [Xanthomonas citri pv. citri]ARR11677.1 hypothetical protein B7L66_05040 [Xanthomonas citri pv. citri]QYF36647.1 hypothetical protein HZS91_03387 [Xanthomonas citri pv. citri]